MTQTPVPHKEIPLPETDYSTLAQKAVSLWLQGIRLPLTAAETVAGKRGAEPPWGPTVTFDAFASKVRTSAGSLLHDERLIDQGRLQDARVVQLRRATELETEAEATRSEAEVELNARREAEQRQRVDLEEARRARDAELAREKVAQERAAQERIREQELTTQKIQAAQDKVLSAQERSARKAKLAADRATLAKEKQAVMAKERAASIENELDRTKALRQAKS